VRWQIFRDYFTLVLPVRHSAVRAPIAMQRPAGYDGSSTLLQRRNLSSAPALTLDR